MQFFLYNLPYSHAKVAGVSIFWTIFNRAVNSYKFWKNSGNIKQYKLFEPMPTYFNAKIQKKQCEQLSAKPAHEEELLNTLKIYADRQ